MCHLSWNCSRYCEIILFRGVFNYVECVGKTIHEIKYQQYKSRQLDFRMLDMLHLLVNHVNIGMSHVYCKFVVRLK